MGQPFPKLELNRWLNTEEGKPLDTTNAVTLYRFWTDTCPFCQATLPAVEILRKKYAADNKEAAVTMTTEALDRAGFRRTFDRQEVLLYQRWPALSLEIAAA